MSRRAALLALSALSLATSACDKKATGQTVAVVNGEEISAGELNQQIAQLNLPPNADKKAVQAQVLQTLVNRTLMAQKARESGIDKSPEFISRQRLLEQELLISMAQQRQNDSARLPDQRQIDQFIASNPGMFGQRQVLKLDQVAFPMLSSQTQLDRLKNDHSLKALTTSLTSMGVKFQRGQGNLDTATVPPAVLKQLNALPPGEPFVVPQNGQMIASAIVSRETVPMPAEQSRRLALETMKRQNASKSIEDQVKALRASAKIEYQPGYEAPAQKGGAAPAAKS
jgi:peptidyl-prolyl cis-trans isomerase C